MLAEELAISAVFWTLRRTAALLKGRARKRKALPGLLAFTDPDRTPDIAAMMQTLPKGSAVVFRAFGAAGSIGEGRRLAAIARRRGLLFLVGADPGLAAAVGATGVHLPERMSRHASRLKRARPYWIITVAAHGLPAARRALASGADAVVVSAIFQSRSASAGKPLGPMHLAVLVRAAGGPVYALGGVNDRTASRLADTGVVGLAAVEGI